jgi:release factor glutamine methyltransferase
VTVLEVIQRSAAFLAKKDVESPRLQVELMLAQLLRLRRMDLYLNFERILTPKELDDLRKMVARRGQREPLQHILGTACFWGLEIAVNANVLVPRPETELLAEMGWQFLNGRTFPARSMEPAPISLAPLGGRAGVRGKVQSVCELNEAPPPYAASTNFTALDFGTGSGCLAIALAMKCLTAQIVALDVSPEALHVAKENAARHKIDSRIRFMEGNGLASLSTDERFDLIVANPPYIPSEEIATLDPEVRDYDPRLALDGGADGLDFYRRLACEAGNFLKLNGRIMLELGDGQAASVQKLFEAQKWVVEAIKSDYNGRPRILVAHR